jgi:hypothetical protein
VCHIGIESHTQQETDMNENVKDLNTEDISLDHYVDLIKRRYRSILLVAMVFGFFGVLIAMLIPSQYEVYIDVLPPRISHNKYLESTQNMTSKIRGKKYDAGVKQRAGEAASVLFVCNTELGNSRNPEDYFLRVLLVARPSEIPNAKLSLKALLDTLREEYEPGIREIKAELIFQDKSILKKIEIKTAQKEKNARRIGELGELIKGIRADTEGSKEPEGKAAESPGKAGQKALFIAMDDKAYNRIYIINLLGNIIDRLENENIDFENDLMELNFEKDRARQLNYTNSKGDIDKIFTREKDVFNIETKKSGSREFLFVRKERSYKGKIILVSLLSGLFLGIMISLYKENRSRVKTKI